MRVLVLGPFAGEGGLARVARQTVEGLDPNRFDILACDTSKDTPEGRSLVAACWSHVRRWRRLVRALREHRPHVVHLHTCSYHTFFRTLLDVWTCRAFRRAYVLHIHGGLFAEFIASLGGVRRSFVESALRDAHRVVVLGETWRTKIMQQVAGLRIAVISNAVDLAPAPPEDASRGGGVLFVGDLSEPKRPEDLLVAYAALPSPVRGRFALTLVGNGEASRRRRLNELANRLGLTNRQGLTGGVRFAGSLDHAQAQDLMRCADVLVIPSRAEGMPLVLLEAMQAALPAIATRVGAIPEMVTHGIEALLVEPRDTASLASNLKRLLGDDAARRAMGQAARRRAKCDNSTLRFRSQLAEIWSASAATTMPPLAPPVPKLASPSVRTFL